MKQSTKVYNYIVSKINKGDWAPGSKLPTELELAKTLNVGRVSVREAQKQFIVLGILSKKQGRGTFVEEPNSAMSLLSLYPQNFLSPDLKGIEDILEFRLIVDPPSARIFSQRARNEEIVKLEKIFEKMEKFFKNKDRDNYTHYDSEFHLLIMKHNSFLSKINEILHTVMRQEMLYDWGGSPEIGLEEHRNILNAIVARDGEFAEIYMKRHILRVIKRFEQNNSRDTEQKNQISKEEEDET